MRITICANCLTTYSGAMGFPVGPEYGSQRDPEQDRIDLCGDCAGALRQGDMAALHGRYRDDRTIPSVRNPE